jgi:hypothetical protein
MTGTTGALALGVADGLDLVGERGAADDPLGLADGDSPGRIVTCGAGAVAGNATRRSGTTAASTGRTPSQHTAMPARVAAAQTVRLLAAFHRVRMAAIFACL